jgi:hypothetical protein
MARVSFCSLVNLLYPSPFFSFFLLFHLFFAGQKKFKNNNKQKEINLFEQNEIYLAYIWLIVYHSLFEFALAVSSVQVARKYVMRGKENTF